MAIKRQKHLNKPSRTKMVVLLLIGLFLVAALGISLKIYNWTFGANVELSNENYHYIFLPNGSDYQEVLTLLGREKILKNAKSFEFVARVMGYDAQVKPGRYKIANGTSNYELIAMLRSGRQEPVMVTLNEIRTIERLAQIVSKKIEADSSEIVRLLSDNAFLSELGFESHQIIAMFVPNSYQFYWNTNAREFALRMNKEYQKFWNGERRQKADLLKLSPLEVSVLASIVDEETAKNDEKATIAGLYLNRLRKGMLLQADPTVKFALGDFSINRILTRDLQIDSPYNTYKYTGLPPGPLRMPSVAAIDAVLSPEEHDYIYMCAKEDFSGYHSFAKTLDQHNRNAARYRKALKERQIWR